MPDKSPESAPAKAPKFEALKRGLSNVAYQSLTPIGRECYDEFYKNTQKLFRSLGRSFDSTDPIHGVMSKGMVMGKDRMELGQRPALNHLKTLLDQMQKQFIKRLFKLDQLHKAVLKKKGEKVAEAEYEKKYEQLLTVSSSALKAMENQIEGMGRLAGGENEFIDTPEEMLDWNGRYLVQLRKLELEDGWLDAAIDAGDAAGFDTNTMFKNYDGVMVLLGKIERDENLSAADLEEIATNLAPSLDTAFDPTKRSQTEAAARALEASHGILLVHALRPADRFRLAKHMNNPKATTLLASLNYLTLEQAQALMPDMAQDVIKRITTSQEVVIKMKKMAAESIMTNPNGNLLNTVATSSVVLLYEIIFRAAVVGMALSLFMNRGDIVGTVTDPIFLAMAAVAAGSYEHVTGGLGKGAITRFITGKRTRYLPEDVAKGTDVLKKERFARLIGRHPQTKKWLLENNATMLKAVVARANTTLPETPESYRFSFADIGLPDVHPDGMDAKTRPQIEGVITDIYQNLYRDMDAKDAPEMLAVFEDMDRNAGLD